MAAITSNGTGGGNWSATATWSGGVVPVAGTDTVTIAGGDTVHADTGALSAGKLIVGPDAGTGNVALTIATNGNLIVDATVAVWMHGDLLIGGSNTVAATLTMAAGSTWVFDPKSANKYLIQFTGNAWSQILCNGTSGSHVIFKTDLTRGGTAAYCTVTTGALPTSGHFWGGFVTCTYTDFTNMGDTGDPDVGVLTFMSPADNITTPTGAVTITNCTFTTCNYWIGAEVSGAQWHGDFHWNNNICSNSVNGTLFANPTVSFFFSIAGAPGAEIRELKNNGFDLTSFVQIDGPQQMTQSGNTFAGNWGAGNAAAWASDSMFANNVIVFEAVHGIPSSFSFGPIKSCYFVNNIHNPTGYIRVVGGASVTACIFEAVNGEGDGAAIIFQAGTGTMTVINNMVIGVNTAGYGSGYLAWIGAGASKKAIIEHNLAISGQDFGMAVLGLGGAAGAGQVTSCRSNLFYSTAIGAGAVVYAVMESSSSTYTLDAVTVAGHNGYFGASVGTVKTSAGGVTTGSVPLYNTIEVTTVGSPLSNGNTQVGFGDFSADPTFVAQRKFATWAGTTAGGGTATVAAGLAQLAANPSLITTPGTGLMFYVKSGYVPTATAYLPANNPSYPSDTLAIDALGNGWPSNTPAVGPLAQSPTYTISGATSGTPGFPSANITITPSVVLGNDIITIALSGTPGGSTSVTTLTFSGSSAAQNFTYTPTSSGTETITLTSADGYTITGSPITFTATSSVANLVSSSTLTPNGIVTRHAKVNLVCGSILIANGAFMTTTYDLTTSPNYIAIEGYLPFLGDPFGNGYICWSLTSILNQSSEEGALRFKATTDEIDVHCYQGPNSPPFVFGIRATIDGVDSTVTNFSYSATEDWTTISGLDGTTEHEYVLEWTTVSIVGPPTMYVDSVRTTGTINTTPLAARKLVVFLGDSITQGSGTPDDITTNWPHQVCRLIDYQVANLGIAGTTVSTASGVPDAGESRTVEITSMTPAPDVIFIMYGVNDIAYSVSVPTFTTSYQNMLTELRAGCPSSYILCEAIMQHLSGGTTDQNAYNTAIQSVVSGLADPKIGYRTGGYDNYDPTTGGGLHPNVTGVGQIQQPLANDILGFVSTLNATANLVCNSTVFANGSVASGKFNTLLSSLSPSIWFKLGESFGSSTCVDSAGGPSGTVTGGTLGEPGILLLDPGTSLAVTGGTENVFVTSISGTPTAFSVGIWINPTATGTQFLIQCENVSALYLVLLGSEVGANINDQSGNRIQVQTVGAGIAIGQTYLIGFTHIASTNTVTIYVNGIVQTLAAYTVQDTPGALPLTSLSIGATVDNTIGFSGSIQDMFLINSALTTPQMLALYQAGSGMNGTANLVCNSMLTPHGVATHRGQYSPACGSTLVTNGVVTNSSTVASLISTSALASAGNIKKNAHLLLVSTSVFISSGNIKKNAHLLLVSTSVFISLSKVNKNASLELVTNSVLTNLVFGSQTHSRQWFPGLRGFHRVI